MYHFEIAIPKEFLHAPSAEADFYYKIECFYSAGRLSGYVILEDIKAPALVLKYIDFNAEGLFHYLENACRNNFESIKQDFTTKIIQANESN